MKRKETICKNNRWEDFKKGRADTIEKYIKAKKDLYRN